MPQGLRCGVFPILALAALGCAESTQTTDTHDGVPSRVVGRPRAEPSPENVPSIRKAIGDSLGNLGGSITLDFQNVDPRRALLLLANASGEELDIPVSIRDKPVSMKLQGARFWPTLDEICRQHGGIGYKAPRLKTMLEIKPRPWIEYPTWYQGPLRLQVYDVARVREFFYPKRLDRTEVALMLQWTHDFLPVRVGSHSPGELRLTRVEDDRGNSLLPPLDRLPGPHFHPAMGPGRSYAKVFPLKAAPGATRLTRVEGVWEGSWLKDLQKVVFEDPASSVGAVRRVGPIKLVLERFDRKSKAHRFEFLIRMSYDPFDATQEWKDSLEEVSLADRLDRKALLEGGTPGMTYMHPGNIGGSFTEWRGLPSTTKVPKALVVRVARSVGTARVPFSFKNVKLPGEGR